MRTSNTLEQIPVIRSVSVQLAAQLLKVHKVLLTQNKLKITPFSDVLSLK